MGDDGRIFIVKSMSYDTIWGMRNRKNTPEVLWSKVDKRGADECWPWLAFKNKSGYGRVEIGGIDYYAHRVIFNLANPNVIDPVNGDQCLLHRCDNPICCNPNHLRVGTRQENSLEMVARGRSPNFKAGRGPGCKLTMQQAKEVRRLYSDGKSKRELSVQCGLSIRALENVLANRSYCED